MTVMLAMLGFCCTNRTDDLQDAGNAPRARDVTVSESMCQDERACDELWGPNTDGCNAHLDACLSALTPDQQRAWEVAVNRCIESTTTCSERFTCYTTAPWC
jgi:hypothetical protein